MLKNLNNPTITQIISLVHAHNKKCIVFKNEKLNLWNWKVLSLGENEKLVSEGKNYASRIECIKEAEELLKANIPIYELQNEKEIFIKYIR